MVLTGSSDNTMGVVNYKLGIVLRTLKGHNDIIWDMELINEDTIASSSTEGNIKVWNWKEG